MTALPLSIGKIHFTGIGGIGMSGIAEILHELGYKVQGSDISESTNVRRLRPRHRGLHPAEKRKSGRRIDCGHFHRD